MTAVLIPPSTLFRGVSAIHKRDRDKRGYRCPRERVFIIQRCMWFIRKIRTGIKAFLTIRYTWGRRRSPRRATTSRTAWPGGGHGHARDRERHTPGTLVPRVPGRRSGGARAEAQGQAQRLEIQTEARTDARAGARRTGRLSEGEGHVPGKTPGPAGVQVTRRERSAVRAPWR